MKAIRSFFGATEKRSLTHAHEKRSIVFRSIVFRRGKTILTGRKTIELSGQDIAAWCFVIFAAFMAGLIGGAWLGAAIQAAR